MAEKAGVSVGTVDRVIHHRGEVSQETREKVLKVIEELNFSPNLIASSLATSKRNTTAVLIPEANKENRFWEEHLRGIKRAGIELAPYGQVAETATFSMSDLKDFRKKSEDILQSKPDSILIAPVFYNESVHFLSRCSKLKIPFICIDTQIDKLDPVSFIGQNSCQSGTVAARLLSMGNNPESGYLILHLTKEKEQLQHLKERERGFRLYFENRGEMPEILTEEVLDLGTKSLRSVLMKAINIPHGLNGIFVSGSKVHLVARILESMKIHGIRLVGYDLLQENRKYLKKDLIHFLISQQPEEQGYLGIKSLFDHVINRKEIPAIQSIPIDVICRENLENYKKCY